MPDAAAPVASAQPPLGYTYQRPDGNRLVAGKAALPETTPLDIELAGTPLWVTAVPLEEGALWAIVLEDTFTQAFHVVGRQVTPVTITPRVLVNVAPLLIFNNGDAYFVTPPVANPGGNHPVRLDDESDHAFSTADGQLFLLDATARDRGDFSALRVLPDGRLLTDENGRLLALTDPTERYDHGVLGDSVEAAGMALITARPEARVVTQFTVPEPQVIEGLVPIWTDWNGDGEREIIVTLSDANQGAQIVLYNEAGGQVAAGPAVGQGYRWRHPLAVAPFGPNGEMELAAVRTPHLGGVVEFYRWEGDALRIVATLPGFTSHVLGSRNLDMAAAGDFDGDGRVELLLPTQERAQLAAVARTADGAEAVWALPLEGQLTTNIGAVTLPDGRAAVGVGTSNNLLRIWQP